MPYVHPAKTKGRSFVHAVQAVVGWKTILYLPDGGKPTCVLIVMLPGKFRAQDAGQQKTFEQEKFESKKRGFTQVTFENLELRSFTSYIVYIL